MSDDLEEVLNGLTASEAMKFVCLFLAQNDSPNPPHVELGYASQSEAFAQIGDLFDTKPRTLQNERDAFDRFTDSPRAGWDKPLPPRLVTIFDRFGSLSRNDLRRISMEILSREWKQGMSTLFERIQRDETKIKVETPYAYSGLIFHFGNTKKTFKFALNLEQIIQSLKDISDNISHYIEYGTEKYEEKRYRKVFAATLTNEISIALAATQTLGFFSTLAKVIHFSSSEDPYAYQTIKLDTGTIALAIDALEKLKIENASDLPSIVDTDIPTDSDQRVEGGQNLIYYGAPGTGKSHALEQQAKSGRVFRTVFHPDVQNSDFFGTLKPVTSEGGKITYRFSPGAFSKALAFAQSNPSQKVWLIIEELNRAPAAAVFGDLFLLLDRDANGRGEYDVDCPSEEAIAWFQKHAGIEGEKIKLPSNLWIVATMNSADQGVYPLDTAFRRRWEQSYVPLVYDKGPVSDLIIAKDGQEPLEVSWLEFVRKLNSFLMTHANVAEDRLVGPWFVKPSEFGVDKRVPSKLAIYLWDDLFRTHGREIIFDHSKLKTYGGLSKARNADQQIFADRFLETFEW